MARPKKNEDVVEVESTKITETTNKTPEVLKPLKVYEVPETREELLALIKCLENTGVKSIGDLEVRASRL